MAVHRDEGADLPDRGRYPPRRRTKWFLCVALICLSAAGLYVGGRWYARQHAFAKRVQAIRATGCPVTAAELDKWYKWPESGANAAALVLEAASCYVAPSDSNAAEELWSILRGQAARRAEPLRDSTRRMLTEYIQANTKALELLREAAATKDSRYPLDAKSGYAVRLAYLGGVVNKAGILPCLEAILYAEDGDPAGAGAALVTALGVARSLVPEPMLIGQINRLTCQKSVLSALERVLSRTPGFTDAQLLALSEAVAGAYDPNGWTRALIGERCLLIGLYEQPGLAEGPLPNSPLRRTIINTYKRRELSGRSEILFLDLMDRLLQARQLPPQQRMSAAKAVDAARNALPKPDFIIHEWMPSAVAVVKWELTEMARLATASCGPAVERYRLAHGSLPETLADLVPGYLPDVPADPFDGKPLRYKHLEQGYVVYSVGPDGNDDGGKERPPAVRGKPNTSPYDVTFIVER